MVEYPPPRSGWSAQPVPGLAVPSASLSWRFDTIEVPLAALKAASAVDASINDTFLSA